MANVDIRVGKKDSTFFSANPTLVLKNGQLIYNETTSELFIGDGVTQLSSLVAINGGGNQTLQQVLTNGNQTNGNSIIVNTGDLVKSLDGNDNISLDSGTYINSNTNIEETAPNITLFGYDNNTNISASVAITTYLQGKINLSGDSITRNSVEIATVNDIVQVNTSTIGSAINGATDATPNDTDLVMSVESSVAKKNTWTQIKAFLKTYFDTVYTTTSAVASQITTALSGYLTSATAASTYATKSATTLSSYLEVPEQSKPATPTNSFRLYADTSNRLSWIGENGYARTFDGTSNTADRTYTLPNESGTLAINATYIVPVGYTTSLNPADSTTYYIGGLLSQSPPTSAGNSRRFAAPITGNATEFRFIFANGTVSTTESNTFVLRNTTQATSVTITNSYAINGQMIANFTGFTLAVNANDVLQIEWTTPAWATNPISTQMSGYIVFTK